MYVNVTQLSRITMPRVSVEHRGVLLRMWEVPGSNFGLETESCDSFIVVLRHMLE
jgi:hypothetical protein